MVNFKETLTKLHKEFPEFDLEKLFKIMECIVEEPQLNLNNSGGYILSRGNSITNTRYPWDVNQITCTLDTKSDNLTLKGITTK